MRKGNPIVALRIVSFKLEEELIKRLDDLADALATKNPGLSVSRTEALRYVLRRGFAQIVEEEQTAQ